MIILVYFTEICCLFSYFTLIENHFDYCLCYSLLCRRENKHFDVHFQRIGPVRFPSKDGKRRFIREEMHGNVFISRQSRHFSFENYMIKVLFSTLYIDLACKQLCFPPRKGYK